MDIVGYVLFMTCAVGRRSRSEGGGHRRWNGDHDGWGRRAGRVRWGQGEGYKRSGGRKEGRGKAPQPWGVTREEGTSAQRREQPLLTSQPQSERPSPWFTPPCVSQQKAWGPYICPDTSECWCLWCWGCVVWYVQNMYRVMLSVEYVIYVVHLEYI